MSTGTEAKILTPAEYREAGESLRGRMRGWNMILCATIDDYPIGRRDRGQCRLQVERAKGKGYRTVRTTTDKNGRWCAPKKSTYSNSVSLVVTNVPPAYGHEIQYLGVAETGVYLQDASGSSTTLLKAPYWCKPRRADEPYTVTNGPTMTWTGKGMVAVEGSVATVEHRVLKADSPELCDSWDAWHHEYMILRSIALEAWEGK